MNHEVIIFLGCKAEEATGHEQAHEREGGGRRTQGYLYLYLYLYL